MNSLQYFRVPLGHCLYWNEAHCREVLCFEVRFGIKRVILGYGDKRFDKARMDRESLVACTLKEPPPMMRAEVGFHGGTG